MEQEKIVLLIQKYLDGSITPSENLLLDQWIRLHADNSNLLSQMQEESWLREQMDMFNRLEPRDMEVESLRMSRQIVGAKSTHTSRLWIRYVAAAAVLLAFAISLYLYKHKESYDTIITQHVNIDGQPKPGGNKATITMDNGETIILSEAHSGVIVGDTLAYDDGSSIALSKSQFATINTPRGGQYNVTLPDGTRVLLNTSSSLRYPTNFAAAERKVTLTGEAFFEVAHNAKQPFVVEAGQQSLQVLGTVFNINAYTDEKQIVTTLVEGKVAVSMQGIGDKPTILKPGQQSLIRDKQIKVVAVDVEEETAWKDGKFVFHNSDIYSVMRQIGRWYDVEVSYVDDVSHVRFTGSLSRTASLAHVLEDIELTQSINLKVEGRRVIVRRR